jgi:hypothetical protein
MAFREFGKTCAYFGRKIFSIDGKITAVHLSEAFEFIELCGDEQNASAVGKKLQELA